jgi:hypothetical protein
MALMAASKINSCKVFEVFDEVNMMETSLDCREVERRLAAAVVELKAALDQFENEARAAGRDPRWRGLWVVCHEQAAVLKELEGLGNGGPGGPQPSPRGELQAEMER